MADPAAETTYIPTAADCPVGEYAPNSLTDPRDYSTADTRRVDAKYVMWPLESNVLALNDAVLALGSGVGIFITKNTDYTIPDNVISGTTYFCQDYVMAAPVLTLPSAVNVANGLKLTFIADSAGTYGARIAPNASLPDAIIYGTLSEYTYIEIQPGNTVTLESRWDGASIAQWYVLTPTVDATSGTDCFVNNEEVTAHYFIKGPNTGPGLVAPGPLVAGDFPASVIETAAINNLAVTTAKIDAAAVTNTKLATGAVVLNSSTVTGTLPVTNGGTGVASTTAYSVICGGTTSTGALQSVSGTGTSGYVLTSNGASALPTWQAATSGAVSSVTGTAGQVNISPTTGAVVVALSTYGTAGTYGQVVTDAYGRVTSGATCTVSNGGTGATTFATGNLLVGAGTSAVTVLAPVTNRVVLSTDGVNFTSGQVNLASAQVTGTLPVANGGTGVASTTSYAVLCGGTTSTNPVQSVASVGTSGQVLTSNGAGALPTFQTLSTGMSSNFQYFTGSGTWTKPAGAKSVRVICVGGGGGGGSGRRGAAATVRGGGVGGYAGQVTEVSYDAAQLGATETITIGAAGTGGAVTTSDNTNGNTGVSGGDTFFGGTTASNSKQMAAGGQGGTGGTNTAGGTGGNVFLNQNTTVQYPNLTGGTSSSVTAANSDCGTAVYGPGGGGGGGAIDAANSNVGGGKGGHTDASFWRNSGAGTNGGNGGSGGVGSAGTAASPSTSRVMFGSGGGGGGGGGNFIGGVGGAPGGGGGGGGANTNGANGGAGGAGAAGGIIVITYY